MEALRTSVTQVLTVDPATEAPPAPPVLRLHLKKKPRHDKKVNWREDTVDNEHMGKKKSKCCCIYKKPLAFGESSSEDDEECEHCFGHPEKRRRNKAKRQQPDAGEAPCNDDADGPSCSGNMRSATESSATTVEEPPQQPPPKPSDDGQPPNADDDPRT